MFKSLFCLHWPNAYLSQLFQRDTGHTLLLSSWQIQNSMSLGPLMFILVLMFNMSFWNQVLSSDAKEPKQPKKPLFRFCLGTPTLVSQLLKLQPCMHRLLLRAMINSSYILDFKATTLTQNILYHQLTSYFNKTMTEATSTMKLAAL